MPEKTVERAPEKELARALLAQKRAFSEDGEPCCEVRLADLSRLASKIAEKCDGIADAMNADFGNRSRHESYVAELYTTLAGIRHIKKNLASWMKPENRPVNKVFLPAKAGVRYRARGVAGIISPWNYPFYLAIMPLATALAAGNRVMLKPSEEAPATAALMKEMLSEIFPPERVCTVCGGPEVGAAFSALPFDILLFTGSTTVGRHIMTAAAKNLTPVILELGGKSPALVGPSADLSLAADRVALGKAFNAGQTCVAPDYALVPRAKVDAFAEKVAAVWRKSYPALADNPDYTSIINQRHFERINGLLDDAKQKGARIQHINPTNETLYPSRRKIAPTLVLDPTPEMRLMQEEIFGPILPVVPYGDLSQAVAFINQRPRPLALYVFDSDRKLVEGILSKTVSGGACVNDVMLHVAQDELPFGGVGESGMGQYHGREGFEAFSHKQAVFWQKTPNTQGFLRPPYPRSLMAILRMLLRWG